MSKLSLEFYQPPFWARNGHLNTIFGSQFSPPDLVVNEQRETVSFADGSKTTVYVVTPEESKVSTYSAEWVVLAFHGLAGSKDSDFLRRVVKVCSANGIISVAVNHRNCGSAFGWSHQSYNSGRGDDVSDVILWARSRFPSKKVAVIGYSLSASMILNLRSYRRGSVQPDLALVVNPPLDLAYSSVTMTKGFSKIYGQHFVRELSRQVNGLVDLGVYDKKYRVTKKINIWDFDDMFTAPMGGYKNASEYYKECSVGPHLHQIKLPTYIFATQDDPFIDYGPLSREKFQPELMVHFIPYGGHLGFVQGWNQKWTERFLNSIFNQILPGPFPKP